MTDREHRSDLMAQILDLICDGDVGGALCDLTKRLYRQPSHTLLLPPSFPSSSTLALIVLFIHSSVGVKELCCCFRRLWWRQLQEPVPSWVICVVLPLNLILFCCMVYLLERFRLSVYTHTHVKVLTLFLISRLSEVLHVLVYSFLPTFVCHTTRGIYECLRKDYSDLANICCKV